MDLAWQADWARARAHYEAWWRREGMVFSAWGGYARDTVRDNVADPGPPQPDNQYFVDPEYRARVNHFVMARHDFLGDTLPIANTMIGPGSLALTLGSEPGFSPQTVWFEPTMQDDEYPEERAPLTVDPENYWLKVHEETCRRCAEMGRGKYLTGIPDLVENIDIISALRDPQTLMMDMLERPDWVEEKVWEINDAYVEVYNRLYEAIKLPDGSSAFACFGIWGPGRTAKVQCDAAAMFSPAMFRRFVVPALTAQCEWLDHSLFHLDGTQCICQLDELLQIEALDAIEWTPQSSLPEQGGSPRWYDMYRRILAAGKGVQAINVKPHEVIPLLDELGPKGMYLMVNASRAEYEALYEKVEAYR